MPVKQRKQNKTGSKLIEIYYYELLERLAEEEVCLCVISKSGTTLDPSIAFGMLRGYLLQQQGKVVEIFEVYEGRLRYFTEWLKQLFGESECKENKGVIPMSLQMSTVCILWGSFCRKGGKSFLRRCCR